MALIALTLLPIRGEEWKTVEIGDFQKLKITSNLNVVYRNVKDSIGYARYLVVNDKDANINFLNKGKGTLRVYESDTQWENKNNTVIYVYSNFLTSVESSSDLTVSIENPAPCASFSINLIGNGIIVVENVKCDHLSASQTTGRGNIVVTGNCVEASFKMVGTGTISADRLQAEDVKCSILGTGTIGCWPIDNLSVKGLGTTKIYYKGKPNIKKVGGGKLFEIPESDNIDKKGVPVESFQPPKEE